FRRVLGVAACAWRTITPPGAAGNAGRAPMRYRVLCQAVSSSYVCTWCGEHRDERLAMLGNAVDGKEQLVHAGDERDLGQLAARTQPFVVRAKPRIAANRGERRHPKRRAQAGIADRRQRSASRLPFSRMTQARDGADVGRERSRAVEVGRVADRGDDARGGVRTDPIDGRKKPADLVFAQLAFDVAIDLAQAAAQDGKVI